MFQQSKDIHIVEKPTIMKLEFIEIIFLYDSIQPYKKDFIPKSSN